MIPVELIKMLMISDLGDKLIQILIGLFVILIACFAWRTTNTNEHPTYRTVVLLERRFRRRTSRPRLTTHIQSTSIVSRPQPEEESTPLEDNQTVEDVRSSETNKPPEASTSSQGEQQPLRSGSTEESQEIEDILRIMDADANEVRRQRLAYFENRQQENLATTSTENSSETQSDIPTQLPPEKPDDNNQTECVNSTVEQLVMEHNYAEREIVPDRIETIRDTREAAESDTSTQDSGHNDSNIRIKLKYLNDELKLVDGRLEEQLGDFKRRHFHVEFSSNKLVRLIFNGQVLQSDTQTLQSCGLFDNCVVHCLIHQQRNVHTDPTSSSGNSTFSGTSNVRSNTAGLSQGNNNNNQGRDWDLGNILFILISIVLGSAWYFRYEYAHLYTVTATVALVAITGIFTIFFIGVYFPDPEPQQQQPRSEQRTIPT